MIHLPAAENGRRNSIHRRRRAPITHDYVYNSHKNNNLTWFYFKLSITMSFSYGYGHQQIGNKNKCRRIAGNFDCHTDAAVRRGAHRLIQHVQGFTRSHWIETTLNTTKTQLILAARGLEEHVWVSLIFVIIVSFMLFTLLALVYVLYFEEFLIHNHVDSWFWRIIDRICWVCAIFSSIPNLQACTDRQTDRQMDGRTN